MISILYDTDLHHSPCFGGGTDSGEENEQLQQLTERICALEEGLRNLNESLQELGEYHTVIRDIAEMNVSNECNVQLLQ